MSAGEEPTVEELRERFGKLSSEELHGMLPFATWPVIRFRPDGGGKPRVLLSEHRSHRAGSCRHCGLILIPGPGDGGK